jgi:polar amino acid transport system substrate-binding protein
MKKTTKRLLALLTLNFALLATSMPLQCQGMAKAPITLSADQDETTYAGRWVWLIYTEAFKRLDLDFKLSANPMIRQSIMADAGQLDGEVARVYGYGDTHPNLVRVEEPVLDLAFSLYSANPALRAQRLEDLSVGNWRGEFRRGVGVCEKVLKEIFPAERLSDVTTSEQGAKKLLADRTDIYCDNEVSMARVLHSREIKNVASIRKLFSLGSPIPTYPYLHKKHAQLAPRLAATLKKMKEEGLMETYRRQAERDMGW